MPKRPVPPEPSSSSLITATKRKKDQPKALKGVRVYVVDAKLDQSTIAELQSLVVAHADKLVSNPSEADIIVTTIRMKARLERHVDWSLAVRRPSLHCIWCGQGSENTVCSDKRQW
jgi:DNA polymerase IV